MREEDVRYEKERDGVRVQVIQDPDAPNPRKEFDSMGHMACWHRRYDLGDENATHGTHSPDELMRYLYQDGGGDMTDPETGDELDYLSDLDMDKVVKWIEDNYVVLPLFLYDHSGITMSTSAGRFQAIDSAGWDWGIVGVIYLSKAEVIHEYGAWNDEAIARAMKYLEGEVQEYDAYLRGDVWGIVVEKLIPCHCGNPECGHNEGYEQLDACWGFYDIDDGGHIREEMKSMLPQGFKDLADQF